MVTFLGFMAIASGIVLRAQLTIDHHCSDRDKLELKDIAGYMVIAGVAIILINAWIAKPVIIWLGG